jgi:hypothetical protein
MLCFSMLYFSTLGFSAPCFERLRSERETQLAPSLPATETEHLRAARNRARAGRKIRRKPRLQNGALKPYLLPKVGTHDGEIVFCETSYYLILKVIAGSGNRVAVTLLVRGPAFFDRFFQTVVEIFVLPPFRDLGLIIEFDLVD